MTVYVVESVVEEMVVFVTDDIVTVVSLTLVDDTELDVMLVDVIAVLVMLVPVTDDVLIVVVENVLVVVVTVLTVVGVVTVDTDDVPLVADVVVIVELVAEVLELVVVVTVDVVIVLLVDVTVDVVPVKVDRVVVDDDVVVVLSRGRKDSPMQSKTLVSVRMTSVPSSHPSRAAAKNMSAGYWMVTPMRSLPSSCTKTRKDTSGSPCTMCTQFCSALITLARSATSTGPRVGVMSTNVASLSANPGGDPHSLSVVAVAGTTSGWYGRQSDTAVHVRSVVASGGATSYSEALHVFTAEHVMSAYVDSGVEMYSLSSSHVDTLAQVRSDVRVALTAMN